MRADGYFEGQGYQITWAFGHLVTLKEPEDYDPALKRWSLETLPIVPEHFGLKVLDALFRSRNKASYTEWRIMPTASRSAPSRRNAHADFFCYSPRTLGIVSVSSP